MKNILLLDRSAAADLINVPSLRAESYHVLHASSMEKAKDYLLSEKIDIVLLGNMKNGEDFCKRIHKSLGIPYTAVTAETWDKELIRTIYKLEAKKYESCAVAEFGDIHIDRIGLRAYAGTCDMDLTVKEYAVLATLVGYEGRPINRQILYRMIWGEEEESQALRTVVSRLKKKLETCSENVRITYDRLNGYRLKLVK